MWKFSWDTSTCRIDPTTLQLIGEICACRYVSSSATLSLSSSLSLISLSNLIQLIINLSQKSHLTNLSSLVHLTVTNNSLVTLSLTLTKNLSLSMHFHISSNSNQQILDKQFVVPVSRPGLRNVTTSHSRVAASSIAQ